MALFRKFFYKKPPDGLLEIAERVYVFDCCFSTDVLDEDMYKSYMGGIVKQLHEQFPDSSYMVFNFREGERRSQLTDILSEYDMIVMDYPRQYEGCPLISLEMIHHFLRSSESWLSLEGQHNVLLMHCERGGWPVLAFMLAGLLIYRKQYSGEQKTLDMINKQAPRELLQLLSPLNPLPSQLRYLNYISRRNVGLMWPPADRAITLDCVILRDIPNFDGEGGCRPLFRIYGQNTFSITDRSTKVLFSMSKKSQNIRLYHQEDCELVKVDICCHIQGDVVLECINLDEDMQREEMMFRVMFHTAFIRSNILMLNRDEIDILWDAKDRFPKDFRAEILLSDMDTCSTLSIADASGVEEKEGLPMEAFDKAQEIFNSVDWLDEKGDVALYMHHETKASSVFQQKLETNISENNLETQDAAKKLNPDVYQEKKFHTSEDMVEGYVAQSRTNSDMTQSCDLTSSKPLAQSEKMQDAIPNLAQSSDLFRRTPPLSLSMPASHCLLLEHAADKNVQDISVSSESSVLSASLNGYGGNSLPLRSSSIAKSLPPPPPPPVAPISKTISGPPPASPPSGAIVNSASSSLLPASFSAPPLQSVTHHSSMHPSPSPLHSSTVLNASHSPPPPPPPFVAKTNTLLPPPPPKPSLVPPPPVFQMSAVAANAPPPPPPPPLTSKASSATGVVAVATNPPPPPLLPLISRTSAIGAVPPPPPPPRSMSASSKHPGSSNLSFPSSNDHPDGGTSSESRLLGAKAANNGSGTSPQMRTQNNSMSGIKGHGFTWSPSPQNMLRLTQLSSKKTSLKPLHWVKVTRAMQGSLWAESQKQDEAIKPPEFDMSELESLFSVAAPGSEHGNVGEKSRRRNSIGHKSDRIHLIDLRRANNCEIMLTKVKMPLSDLMSALLALDDSILDVDQVDNLIKFCPTKEEMELLKGYGGDKESLGKCEQFFLELMKVPRVESKLRVFSFKIQFYSQVSDLRNNLNVINSAAEEIKNSVKLKRIMQTILSLGNALNQGTARGSAIGFKLDSLLKLTDTRARNNKMTLMHYLCKVLADKLPELLGFPKDLVSLEVASKIQLKTLAEEMQAISKGLEKVEQELTASTNDGPVSHGFQQNLRGFLAVAESEVRSLALLYSGVGRNADALALYFGEDPVRCPFEQVVSTLLNFVKMFGRAHEENCRQAELEKKKAQREAENEKLKVSTPKKEAEEPFGSLAKSVK